MVNYLVMAGPPSCDTAQTDNFQTAQAICGVDLPFIALYLFFLVAAIDISTDLALKGSKSRMMRSDLVMPINLSAALGI